MTTVAPGIPDRPRRVRMLNILPLWMDRTTASVIAICITLPILFVAAHEGFHYLKAAEPLPPKELAQNALKRAQVASIQGFPALAVTEANTALALDNTLAPAWCQRGLAYSSQGHAEAAMYDFNRAIELDPKDKVAYIERGLLRHRAGDDEGAKGDLEAAMGLGWENALAFQNRGIIRLETGDLLGAAEDATAAMKIDHYLPGAYAIRGEAYLEVGQHVYASSDFKSWDEMAPKSAVVQAWQAEVWRRDGDARGAIVDCDKALDLDPTCALAWCFRGLAHLDLKETEFAIADLHTALRFDKKCARAHAGLGRALAVQENYAAAMTELDQAIALHSGLLDAKLLRAWIQAKLGNREESKSEFEAIVAGTPNCWPGRDFAERAVRILK